MTNARTGPILWFGIAPPDDLGHRIPCEIGAEAAFAPLTGSPQIRDEGVCKSTGPVLY